MCGDTTVVLHYQFIFPPKQISWVIRFSTPHTIAHYLTLKTFQTNQKYIECCYCSILCYVGDVTITNYLMIITQKLQVKPV